MAIAVLLTLPAGAGVADLAPEADTFVLKSKPAKNFGGALQLKADAKPLTRAYLRFDVTGLDGVVRSATLRLYHANASAAGYEVRGVADTTWGERTMTFNNAPPVDPAVTDVSGPIAGGTWSEVDVTPLVTGEGRVSLALTTPSSAVVAAASRETSNAPRLTIDSGEPDTAGPTAPTELTGEATSPWQVALSWQPSFDDTGVHGYEVFRDGLPIGTVGGTTTSFIDGTARPATTYGYSVEAFDRSGNRSPPSETAWITTPETGGDPTIVAVGDIACDPAASAFNGGNGTPGFCRQWHTSEVALGLAPTAVITLGDNQYDCAGPAAFLASYDPSWGRLRTITHPSIGNHEYYTTKNSSETDCAPVADARGYFGYFGPSAGDPAAGYYSFDIGNWHLIALNSNCNIVSCAEGSPQDEWLEADLAASTAPCTLAFWHHPRFSSKTGGTTSVAPFWSDLYAADAELVLSGHAHNYERFAPQDPSGQAAADGIRQIVVGTGGRSLATFGTVRPNSEVRDNTAYGVLELTLRDGGYDWRFVGEPGTTFTDSGSGTCH